MGEQICIHVIPLHEKSANRIGVCAQQEYVHFEFDQKYLHHA